MVASRKAYNQLVRRVVVPVAALVLLLLCGLLAALWMVADYQTSAAREEQIKLVDGALAIRGEAIRKFAIDNATWDEAYDKLVVGIDRDWADANIGVWSYESHGIDMALVMHPDGRLDYASVRGRRDTREAADLVSRGMDQLLGEAWSRDGGRPSFGVVLSQGMPAIAAVVPIRRAEVGPVEAGRPHLLILVDAIDSAMLHELARLYLLPHLRVEPPSFVGLATVPVDTVDGTRVAMLTWDGERPGDALLRVAIPVWLAVAFAFAFLVGLGGRQVRSAARLVAASEHRATHDALTDLPNRVLLFEHLDAASRALAEGGAPFAVAYLDLDGFKEINDRHGHDAGDEVLRAVAVRLRASVGGRDIVARLGGDEFALILFDRSDLAVLQQLARRLIVAIEDPVPLGEGLEACVSATIGLSMAPEDGADPLALLRVADQALYAGKRDGRRRACFHAGPTVAPA